MKNAASRGVHPEVGGINGVVVQQECQGDHDAAAHHERQHVGDTVHQVLVEAAAQALACGVLLRGRLRAALGVEDRHLTVGHFLDEFFGFVDAVVHPGEQDGLAVKAGRFHVLVRCHDDAVAFLDLFPGQGVLGAVGAVGLHFHGQTQLVTGLDEGFGGHVSTGRCRWGRR